MADVNYIVRLKDLVSPTLQKLINKSNELSNSVEQVSKKGSMIGDFVKGSLITQGLGMVTGSISGVIEKTIDATAEYQKFQAVLSTTLGSDAMANESMKMIQAFADVTNFSSTELTDSFIKLANRNVVLKTDELTKMADVANATGKSFEQLTEAIIDINNSERWKEIGIKSKVAGDKVQLSWKGVIKEVANTELGVKNAILEFGKMQGVAGMTEKVGNTVGGKISSLKDAWSGIFRDIGMSTSDSIMDVVQVLTDLINTFRSSNFIGEAFNSISDFAKNIKIEFGLILQDGTFQKTFENIRKIVGSLITGLTPLVNFLGKFTMDIINIVKKLFDAWNNFASQIDLGTITKIFENLSSLFSKIWTIWKPAILTLMDLLYPIGDLIAWLFNNIASAFNGFLEIMNKFYDGIIRGINSFRKAMGKDPLSTGDSGAEGDWGLNEKDKTKPVPSFPDIIKDKKQKEEEKPKAVKELGVKGSSVGRETKIVNINIGSLVKDMNITVSDLKTGVQNIREEVAKALIGAVNDTKTI